MSTKAAKIENQLTGEIRGRELEQSLVEMKSLATEIGRFWKSSKSAVELIDEAREARW